MQKNFAIVSVFILFTALQGIEILCLAFTVVYPILLPNRHSLHNHDSAGNTITTIPVPCAMLQVISNHENKRATGLPQP